MKPTAPLAELNGAAFRAWLESMQVAAQRLYEEKRAQLTQLTPVESLAIYLDLWQTGAPHFDFQKPSEYQLRLQKIYRRMLEARHDDRLAGSCD
ncbi:MAG: hypothetical protein N2554_09535 [Fimbriimonadales bacterium]|nr:hypothetical protein [Fimbriimonadales bacterium]